MSVRSAVVGRSLPEAVKSEAHCTSTGSIDADSRETYGLLVLGAAYRAASGLPPIIEVESKFGIQNFLGLAFPSQLPDSISSGSWSSDIPASRSFPLILGACCELISCKSFSS